jgi:RNA recognition motif-containing protein
MVKPSRLTSDLKPTSADFKPRMGIELKPPVADFKPSRIDFSSQVTYNSNHPPADRVVTANRSISFQSETIHPFQSNRALADHEFQLPKQVPGRLDDTLYLNKLPSQDGGINQISSTADEFDDQFLEPEDTLNPGSLDDSYKTPNVYINGLPPHFPEDQLYALAAPFGEVKSVRTFTRHVRDSESGYGFVL